MTHFYVDKNTARVGAKDVRGVMLTLVGIGKCKPMWLT
jgi:hypothetical protein